VPAVHDPLQVVPHAPQLRVSRVVSAHVPEQHMSPLVHALPLVQQAWPAAPHEPDAVWHVPLVHVSPELQSVPRQHGWRAPPHAAAV
jgi:hypothetical protein